MSKNKFDAIVVGSGATGGWAAKELTERGLRVLLLEAGPAYGKDAYAHLDEPKKPSRWPSLSRLRVALTGQHIQAQAMFFNEDIRFLFVNDRQNPYSCEPDTSFLWVRGRQLGGRFLTFGRVLPRMSDFDFKAASRDGVGEDWPIDYAQLAPYYDRVEEFLGIVGEESDIPNAPNGKFVAKAGLTRWEREFKEKVQGRWPDRKVTPWRYMASSAYRNHVPITILAGKKTGLLEICTGAVVNRVLVDKNTARASGVSYIDADTKRVTEVRADVVVLCASTIESVRLLLNSACEAHPNGVGNSSGLLGRYFMDQCWAAAFGAVVGTGDHGWEAVDKGYGDSISRNPGGIYIPRFQNISKESHPQFKRGFNIQGAIGRFVVPDGAPPLFGFTAQGEMLPYYDNRISLDRSRTDAWGIPVPRIRCVPGQNEINMLRNEMETLMELVALSGYEIEFAGSQLGIDNSDNLMPHADWLTRFMFRRSHRKTLGMGAAIHECGGARMGVDPEKSVLNPINQVWDVKNLFVTDPSCFVSNGTCGPTHTAMAITVRACEYIGNELGKSI